MANEFQVTGGLTLTNGSLVRNFATTNFKANQTTAGVVAGAPSIPTTTTGTALTMGAVTTAGWARFTNLDTVNFIRVGTQVSGAFVAFVKILPGQTVYVPLATTAPYAVADTAAVVLDYTIFQA